MMVRKFFLSVAGMLCAGAAVASPVAVDWKAEVKTTHCCIQTNIFWNEI